MCWLPGPHGLLSPNQHCTPEIPGHPILMQDTWVPALPLPACLPASSPTLNPYRIPSAIPDTPRLSSSVLSPHHSLQQP